MTAEATASLPRPHLFADRGCGYAHRVHALLHHLGVEYGCTEAPLGDLPAGVERWSPSGRIPLLVHGELVIGETAVIMDYLAEAYGFAAAYPAELVPRTRHRHAIRLLDAQIAPTLTGHGAPPAPARLAECLDLFEDLARSAPPAPSLLAFHSAPVWLRLRWWHPDGVVTRAVARRPALTAWLDAALDLDAVARTAPTEAESTADFRVARAKHGQSA